MWQVGGRAMSPLLPALDETKAAPLEEPMDVQRNGHSKRRYVKDMNIWIIDGNLIVYGLF